MWFPTHPILEDTLHAMVTNLSWDVHECVTDAFLNLAREQHVQGYMDADLQYRLGSGFCIIIMGSLVEQRIAVDAPQGMCEM